jgi:hypothetical protein
LRTYPPGGTSRWCAAPNAVRSVIADPALAERLFDIVRAQRDA